MPLTCDEQHLSVAALRPIAYHKEIHLIVGFRDVDRHGGMHDPRGSAARPPLPTSTSTSRRMRCRRWPRDGATIPTPRLYCGRDTRVALLGVANSGHLRCAWVSSRDLDRNARH